MNPPSQKTTVSVTALSTAAILVTALSLLTTPGATYAQEEEFNVDVAIDSASFDRTTREITVDFTVTCSQPADFELADAFVSVSQSAGGEQGRFGGKTVSGSDFVFYECSGETPLSVTIEPDRGFFTPGRALVFIEASACAVVLDEIVCDAATIEQRVKLTR